MEKEPLSFKHNSCRIDLYVAGMHAMATGFIYVTSPVYDYNYVFTARHSFQEDVEFPNYAKLSDLEIRYDGKDGQQTLLKIEDKDIKKDLMFLDNIDLAIIKIPKSPILGSKRIIVKNIVDVKRETRLFSDSFPSLHRIESTNLEYNVKDNETGTVRLNYVWDITKYNGVSGSGLYCSDEPYLVGVLSGFRLDGFEQSEIRLTLVDWDKVNEKLHLRGWTRLNTGGANNTKLTEDRDIIDSRELTINGTTMNMEHALSCLQHDVCDDWFFDPLHYVDLCKTEFVLDYFSKKERREHYKPEQMEVFYLPKKSFVLRKALVGTFVDRLVYTSVVNTLGPTIDRHLAKEVFSARYNFNKNERGLIVNGVEQWTKLKYYISSWLADGGSGCVVKLDLLNYYDTINMQKLIRLLNEVCSSDNEKSCTRLLETLLCGFSRDDDKHGIPQNCDASSLLATFYVSHVDEFILSKAIHYCRFMDDMYFMASDVYEARDILQSIEKHLRDIDLSLNAQKVEFYELNKEEDILKLKNHLTPYDHNKTKIRHLIKSDVKGRRMNGVKLLVDQLKLAINMEKKEEGEEIAKERAMKFSVHALTSYKLELYTYEESFLEMLKTLTEKQKDAPELTPLLCQLIANLNKNREIDEIKCILGKLVTRKLGSIYEWQAYHLWMLLAYLKYQTPELVRNAAKEIERNDETKTVEVAAIFIYMVTINPEYARILLHRLRDKQLHGNLQKRCALIAMRALDNQVIDDEVLSDLCDPLKECHAYLNKHKEKDLVFFHNISSTPLTRNESVLFPEFYSGL